MSYCKARITLEDQIARRPVDREAAEAIMAEMLNQLEPDDLCGCDDEPDCRD